MLRLKRTPSTQGNEPRKDDSQPILQLENLPELYGSGSQFWLQESFAQVSRVNLVLKNPTHIATHILPLTDSTLQRTPQSTADRVAATATAADPKNAAVRPPAPAGLRVTMRATML